MARCTRRAAAGLVLAAALSACAPTAPMQTVPGAVAATGQTSSFVIPPQAAQDGPDLADRGPQASTPGQTAAGGTATPAPATTPPPAVSSGGGNGGGSGGGVAVTLDPSTAHLTLPGGQILQLPADDTVALPAGTTGEVLLDAPGRVPSTVMADGQALTLHPAAGLSTPVPTTPVHVTGQVSPATEGLQVSFITPGRQDLQGGLTDASGHFAFDVTADAATQGLVLARGASAPTALGLARITVDPAQPPAPVALTLADPGDVLAIAPATYRLKGFGDLTSVLPAPPQDLAYEASVLQVLEGGSTPWVASLLELSGSGMPAYTLDGFSQLVMLRAANIDHTRGSAVVAPVGASGLAWPKLLPAPDLSAVAVPRAGTTLSWPAVTGAGLYVVRVYNAAYVDLPIWEGATTGTHLGVPAGLDFSGPLRVRVDAWDEPDVTVYSIASLPGGPRQLRVPADLTGPTGRHSWATKEFTP